MLHKLYRFYRYNFLPRYPPVANLRPHPLTSEELHGRRLSHYYADLVSIGGQGLDSSGIIMLRAPGARNGPVFNPCMVAQYAMAQHEAFLRTYRAESEASFRRHLDWLQENASPFADGGLALYYQYDTPEETAPWISGIAQGMAISALLRGYQHFGEDRYLETARQLFDAMDTPVSAGGCRFGDDQYRLWYEEDTHTGHILNGHLFALLGVHDLFRITQEGRYQERFDAGLQATKDNLDVFDLGFTTKYRAKSDLPANNSYHYFHAVLFEICHRITGDETLGAAARRFYDYHYRRRYRVRAFLHLLATSVKYKRAAMHGARFLKRV
jgi:hypothetical protein